MTSFDPLETELTFHVETPNGEVSYSATVSGFPPYQKDDFINVKLTPNSEMQEYKVALVEHYFYANTEKENIDQIGLIVHLQMIKPTTRVLT